MTPSERDRLTRDTLKHYQRLRARVEQAEEDAESSQYTQGNTNGRVKGGVSCPIERGAEILLRVDQARKWLTAIDEAIAELERYYPDVAEIVKKHFRIDRARGYVRKYARYTRDAICESKHISIPMYYNLLDQGVDIVRFHAGEYGLFRNLLF